MTLAYKAAASGAVRFGQDDRATLVVTRAVLRQVRGAGEELVQAVKHMGFPCVRIGKRGVCRSWWLIAESSGTKRGHLFGLIRFSRTFGSCGITGASPSCSFLLRVIVIVLARTRAPPLSFGPKLPGIGARFPCNVRAEGGGQKQCSPAQHDIPPSVLIHN
jgi:hypothetical protein